ncbi:MAG: amidohydrolase family protein [Betaproteobacteria bacterium]|nr:amidohydrolase family protein [Betaproteobacteria bacterium]
MTIDPSPLASQVWLVRAGVPPSLSPLTTSGLVALRLAHGKIAQVLPQAAFESLPASALPVTDLDGSTVLSAFVDPHVHLDKGDLCAAGLAPERDLFTAITRVRDDYARWSAEELTRRMEFALRSAYAHGTRALNSYCDWSVPQGPLAWRVLQDLRTQWAGRVDLTITSLAPIAELDDATIAATIAATVAEGGGVLGWFIYPGAPMHLLPRAFDLAQRHDLRLDFHVDEHLDPPQANLGAVARLAHERDWGARTVCGHACVLAALEPAAREALLNDVAASGLGLVSLPWTNLYLQDNGSGPTEGRRRTPSRRGLLPVHEVRARGIPLAFASDNHRDPFFPGGDLDPLQTLSLAALAAQLDEPIRDWADTITCQGARLLHLSWDGVLREGAPADLVIHPGRDSVEVVSRPTRGRRVLRSGQWLAPADALPPDFRELDGLRRAA